MWCLAYLLISVSSSNFDEGKNILNISELYYLVCEMELEKHDEPLRLTLAYKTNRSHLLTSHPDKGKCLANKTLRTDTKNVDIAYFQSFGIFGAIYF